jgi:hypothetical protein
MAAPRWRTIAPAQVRQPAHIYALCAGFSAPVTLQGSALRSLRTNSSSGSFTTAAGAMPTLWPLRLAHLRSPYTHQSAGADWRLADARAAAFTADCAGRACRARQSACARLRARPGHLPVAATDAAGMTRQEQLHLRRWLRQQGVPELFVPVVAAAEVECEVCGTVPFFAVVRCACSATRLACLHHGTCLALRCPLPLPADPRQPARAQGWRCATAKPAIRRSSCTSQTARSSGR